VNHSVLPTPKRVWILVLAALAFLVDGVGTQAMGLAMPALLSDWHLARAAFALPIALGLVGFAVGAVAGGLAGDRFGPVRTLVTSLLLLGLCTAGSALAHDPPELGLWRILAGLGLGASLPIAATVIADYSTERRRALALAVGLAFLPLGGFLIAEAAAVIVPSWGWRGLFAVCGAVAIVLAGAGAPAAFSAEPRQVDTNAPREQGGLPGFTLRLGARVRDTIGLWIAFFCTVLLYYSMFSWAPTALIGSGLSIGAVSRTVSLFSIGGLVGGLATGLLVQRLGSRLCLAVLGGGAVACGLALPHVVPSGGAALLPLIATVALLGVSVIGIQTLLYVLGARVYPLAHRATGLGLAVACGRLGAIASSYTGVTALDHGGFGGFCDCLALAALLAVAAALLVSQQIPARLRQGSGR
jgi:AAHS family 4-hydroxybenzoate transporter-like MFS transporter